MEKNNCIICNLENNHQYLNVIDRFNKDYSFNLVKCICGLIYLDPRPEEESIGKYYPKSNYDPHKDNNFSLFSKLYIYVQKYAFRRKLKLIQKYYNKPGIHLDIGGGKGDFCKFMQNQGWSTTNQEVSKQALKISNKHSIVSIQDIDQNIKSESIDLITAWHSIEHIHRIDRLFLELQRILKPKNYFLLCVPNSNAIEQSFYKNKWVAWDAPRHLYHFTPELLKKYVEKNNFEVIYYESLLQDTAYNILLSIDKKNIYSYLKSFFVILISYFVIAFCGYKKSSSFIMVCRKK